ncbi:hypothetical protein BC831DRAFT_485837 [Entophlyctis helioformis]|nr:hypothetical protein BC831DRAFT_485837 [Entophlyctis helioformis]
MATPRPAEPSPPNTVDGYALLASPNPFPLNYPSAVLLGLLILAALAFSVSSLVLARRVSQDERSWKRAARSASGDIRTVTAPQSPRVPWQRDSSNRNSLLIASVTQDGLYVAPPSSSLAGSAAAYQADRPLPLLVDRPPTLQRSMQRPRPATVTQPPRGSSMGISQQVLQGVDRASPSNAVDDDHAGADADAVTVADIMDQYEDQQHRAKIQSALNDALRATRQIMQLYDPLPSPMPADIEMQPQPQPQSQSQSQPLLLQQPLRLPRRQPTDTRVPQRSLRRPSNASSSGMGHSRSASSQSTASNPTRNSSRSNLIDHQQAPAA